MILFSFLLYPTLSAQATENDGAVLIRLGGEVVSAEKTVKTTLPTPAPITSDIVQMNIQDVVRLFAIHSGQNIVISDGVDGTVSAQVNNVPWNTALQAIVQSNGWTLVAIGEILMITKST